MDKLNLVQPNTEEYPPLPCTLFNIKQQTARRGKCKDDSSEKTIEEAELRKVCRPANNPSQKRVAVEFYDGCSIDTNGTEYTNKYTDMDTMEPREQYQQPWERTRLIGNRFCKNQTDCASRTEIFQQFYSNSNILADFSHFSILNPTLIVNENESSKSKNKSSSPLDNATNLEPVITTQEWIYILEEFENNHIYGPDEPTILGGIDDLQADQGPGEGRDEWQYDI